MPKEKIILFCTLLFYACVFCGCERAPEFRSGGDENKSINWDAEKFVSLQEAREQTVRLEGQELDGIVLPSEIDMADLSQIAVLKLQPWYTKNVNVLLKPLQEIWNDYQKVDWKKAKRQKFSRTYDSTYYAETRTDEQTGYLYSCDSRGFFSGDSLNDTELTAAGCVKEYDFLGKETALTEKDQYPMEDGSMSVQKAVAYTENKFNQNLTTLENDKFQYKVQHVYVIKHEDSNFYDYNMVVGRLYQDIPIETCTDFSISQGKYYDKIHGGVSMLAIMRHKNTLDYVNVSTELLDVASEEKEEKMISPIWAVSKINANVAHINGMVFSQCGLVYLYVQKNAMANKKEQAATQEVDDTTYLRPVWLFSTKQSGNSFFEGFTNDRHGASVVVDAVDGTLYYYEGTGAY